MQALDLRHGENSADDHRDWYHKRNLALILVNANANNVNFPGSNFASSYSPILRDAAVAT
ncbi:hypothetical protein COCCADRAFT_6685 [Bipolaris zeicola 26-R-13]|uniref:Uncharacterized protein n=1 Tax=Cochliobolus carbonum (strain 26-R-13) TaxID=930089 RepID=W6Y0D3_COCC2|nr:uncharacterized protein COCCADRAFT_6685 [Bipolaris zeicola 26-R-13]EUC31438.1 hypothetical protein COCCADRAFT_6685 [Bipolaris zeicola 26-R-13]